jgi:hypothetical protein
MCLCGDTRGLVPMRAQADSSHAAAYVHTPLPNSGLCACMCIHALGTGRRVGVRTTESISVTSVCSSGSARLGLRATTHNCVPASVRVQTQAQGRGGAQHLDKLGVGKGQVGGRGRQLCDRQVQQGQPSQRLRGPPSPLVSTEHYVRTHVVTHLALGDQAGDEMLDDCLDWTHPRTPDTCQHQRASRRRMGHARKTPACRSLSAAPRVSRRCTCAT